MTLHRWLAAAAAIVTVSAAALAAQTKPDFNGTWDVNPEKTAADRAAAATTSPGGGGGGGLRGGGGNSMSAVGATAPMPYVIKQTARELTITRDFGDGTVQKWVYRLDGSESVNTNLRTTLTTRSTFTDGKLVTEGKQATKTDQAEVTGTFKEVRWIDKDGAMHVHTTRVMNGGAPTTSYQVLDKKTK
jgi:hypothetical protein